MPTMTVIMNLLVPPVYAFVLLPISVKTNLQLLYLVVVRNGKLTVALLYQNR